MTTIQQRRRRLAEEAASAPPTTTGGAGFWQAGAKLCIGSVTFPRGAILEAAIIEAIPAARLDVMRRNQLVVWRTGPPPAAAPKPVKVAVDDPKKAAAAQRASLESAGLQPWELDHKIPAPPGAYAQTHPSQAVQTSARPLSGKV